MKEGGRSKQMKPRWDRERRTLKRARLEFNRSNGMTQVFRKFGGVATNSCYL